MCCSCFVRLLCLAGALLFCRLSFGDDPNQAERLRRFNDAKFGMFIHWGPYSLASVEASWPIMEPAQWNISEADYRALPKRFNPVKYDPEAWVQLARDAGQRYMVFTSKHHDGFCMFDSMYTDYKITKTPYGKDVVAALAAAAREAKMPLGFYYSPPDMNHPGFRDTSKPSRTNWRGEPARPEWPLYLDYMELQLRELLTRYGDLFLIWFDGLGQQEKYAGARFHKLIHEMQPFAIINNRIGLTGDYVTPEQRLPKGIPVKGANVGATDPADKGLSAAAPRPEEFQPWETCMTINETWGYNKNDTKYKSKTDLIRALIDAASKGGNFLLNVGPTPEGTIQPEFEERLRGIGQWLKTNGEAIYGTTYGPLQDLPFGRTTSKGKTIYLHVFDWPGASMELTGLNARVRNVRALSGGAALKYAQTGDKLVISTDGATPDPDATVLAIETR
ncbi:MAG: alpha-L-fucosidase [Bryobacteraceae bacterium]|nr:alpha-L-fucosidase [Bryobacteraceae bacterium]